MLPVKYCIKDDFKRGQSLSEFARRSTMTLDVENAVRNILSGCKERSVSCSRGVALLVFGAILEKDGQLQSIQDVNQGLLTQHINESIIKICDNTHPVSLATLNLQIEYKSLRQVRDLKLQKDIGWMTKQIGDMLHQHRHVPYGAQDSTFLSRLEKDVHSYVRKTARLLSERGIFSETVNNRIVRAISPNVLRLSVESFALSSSAVS